MQGTGPEATLGLWLTALIPIAALLIMLVLLRWKGSEAGPVGFLIAGLIAILLFDTPWDTLAVGTAKGVWDAIFILYVVWPAMLLYLITVRAGAFEALREGFIAFSRNELFLVLAIGWVFASFFQGISGFGTPIAVVAPLLLGLGVRPLYAVAIPLIGHAWANMFGTLAVGWLATLQVIDLENPTGTAVQSAILLWAPNLLAGITIAWMYGRLPALTAAWPLILIISGIHGGVQLLLMYFNPILSNFIAGTIALFALYPLSHWRRYAEEERGIPDRPIMERGGAAKQEGMRKPRRGRKTMPLALAIMPYMVLTAGALGALLIPPVEEWLSRLEIGLPFPQSETALGVVREAEDPYAPFAPLTHPGSFLLLASGVSWIVYRRQGYLRGDSGREQPGLGAHLLKDAVPASIAVTAFLTMSKLMDHSGQTAVLARGIAAVAAPVVFAFASNFIGILGAFMTSSNTASNILFAPLQQEAAAALNLPEATIIAAQSTGGAIGNAVAPANIVLGTSTTGIVGQEGDVLRRTLPWSGILAIVTGVLTAVLLGVL